MGWWLLLIVPGAAVLVATVALAIWYVIAARRLRREIQRWRAGGERRR